MRRAQAVKQFLVAKGMDGGRLDTVGYGSEKLLNPDRPEDSSNRRVEISVIGAATLLGIGIDFSGLDPMKALFWSAVINGFVAVPVMAAMMAARTVGIIRGGGAGHLWRKMN